MGNENDKKKLKKNRPKGQKRFIMSFSEAEKKNLLEKWMEDMYKKNKNKIINYPNKLLSLNDYLYQCLYVLIKLDPTKINVYCPYCLKSEDDKSVIEPIKPESYIFNLGREYYIEQLLKNIKEDETIKNEDDILKRNPKYCHHFFHKNCIEEIEKKYKHRCFYCEHYISAENLFLIKGFQNYEELRQYVAYFKDVHFNIKKCYHFQERALEFLRNFIMKDQRFDIYVQGSFLKRDIEIGTKFRSLGDKYDYKYYWNFCVNFDKAYEYTEELFKKEEKNAIAFYEEKMRKEKERKERKRREKEEFLRQRIEAEEEEKEEEEEEEHPNISSKSKKRYGKFAHTCYDCSKVCFICRKKDYPMYPGANKVHLDCLPSIKYYCVSCKQGKFDSSHDVKYCKNCRLKLNRKNCILCNGEIDAMT